MANLHKHMANYLTYIHYIINNLQYYTTQDYTNTLLIPGHKYETEMFTLGL